MIDVLVTLSRESAVSPWGFRLQGGADLPTPLQVQRVFLGSPSEGLLHRGDFILSLNGRPAQYLTHAEAANILDTCGCTATLHIRRFPGGYSPASPLLIPSGSSSKASPACPFGPLPTSEGKMPHRPGPNQTQATITVQRLPPGAVPAAPGPFYQDGNFEYKEGFIVPEPLVDGKIETLKERARVTNQVYRNAQLILPGPKATHDCVLGSYLRHVREPYFSTVQVPYGSDMHTRVTQTVNQRAFPQATSDGRRIIHQTYNNPSGLYSSQNAQDAFSLHTGMHSPRQNPAAKLSDITMSPTYQFLHGGEPVQSHSPSTGQVYSPQPQAQGGQPWGPSQGRHGPAQSSSFNTIMHSVCAPGSNL